VTFLVTKHELPTTDTIDDSMLADLFHRLSDEGQRLMMSALGAGSLYDLPFVQLLEQASLPQKAAASEAGLRALDSELLKRHGGEDRSLS
jgi:hypothetical protein